MPDREPRLWIEKLVIYKSTEPLEEVRAINFTRGMNVVWGVAQKVDDEDESPGQLTGHSVGKTSLCRLIRYCLGEHTFARKATVLRTRNCLPEGAVGAQLHVDGEMWSVVRPLGAKFDSIAMRCELDEIFHATSIESSYELFTDHLKKQFISPLLVRKPPFSDKQYTWYHLLSWLTRDQEARFQSYWQCRSSRSEAPALAYSRPEKDAVFLMRLVLDLADKREVELLEILETDENKLAQKQSEARVLAEEPKWERDYNAKMLSTELRRSGYQFNNDAPDDLIDGFNTVAKRYVDDLRDVRIVEKKQKVDKMGAAIGLYDLWIQGWNEKFQKNQVTADILDEISELASTDEDILELRKFYEKICVYGNVDFEECEHYRRELAMQEGTTDIQQAAVRQMAANGASKTSIIRHEIEEAKRRINSLLDKRSKAVRNKKRIEREIDALKTQSERAENYYEQMDRALKVINGDMPNTELSELQGNIDALKQDIAENERLLGGTASAYYQKTRSLEAIYDMCVKRVLSQEYSGTIDGIPDRIEFKIEESSTGMAGEAVESLSLVLADIASMLFGVEQTNKHPGFLLHDSPREADLDEHVYNRFMRGVYDLSQEHGGAGAPFQYIITTTSKPPEKLRDSVCLQLEAHPEGKLLFGQVLRSDGYEAETE